MLIIRSAQDKDLNAITEIYNDAIENSLAIWTEDIVNVDNRRTWMKERIAAGFPILVAEENDVVCGYATYGQFRAFSGFRHSAELSIYLNQSVRRRGLGKKLLGALISEAEQRNIHVLIAGIESSNTASIALHRDFGFIETARMPEVGQKFNRWLELVFMQKILQPAAL